MNASRTHCLLALVTAGIGALTATVYGDCGESQTAFYNFPEDPTNIYVHGGSQGAIVADDVVVAPGTEGMRIAEIEVFLVAASEPIVDAQLLLYEHDPGTDMPGQLIGTMDLPEIVAYIPKAFTFDVCALGAHVPASGQFWVGIFIPAVPYTGWFIPGTAPTIGSSPNPIVYQGVEEDAFHPIGPINLMLAVNVVPEPCPADFTGPLGLGNPDGNVDALDFLALIALWGADCEVELCFADITGPAGAPDGAVDALDFLELIAEWGSPANCVDAANAPKLTVTSNAP